MKLHPYDWEIRELCEIDWDRISPPSAPLRGGAVQPKSMERLFCICETLGQHNHGASRGPIWCLISKFISITGRFWGWNMLQYVIYNDHQWSDVSCLLKRWQISKLLRVRVARPFKSAAPSLNPKIRRHMQSEGSALSPDARTASRAGRWSFWATRVAAWMGHPIFESAFSAC